MTTADDVLKVLKSIEDSGSGKSVVALNWVGEVRVNLPRVVLRLSLPDFAQKQRDRIAKEIKQLLLKFDDVSDIQIELANVTNPSIGNAGHGEITSLQPIRGIKKIIAVSSGKGGVGKTTVAVNLACSIAQQGFKVGLLDADIYGPNTPTMLGIGDVSPEVSGEGANQKITPIDTCGISMVSMGLLIDEDQPVIWRGPMLNGIIRQFLYQTNWGNKDFLVVDLPPGTGDAQLSLAQSVPMAGVLIVTTPQRVALEDSRRGLAMFKKMNVPVLGVIENMTAFIPPDNSNKRYELFGAGGGQQLASENDVPLLSQIPMEMPILQNGNKTMPLVNIAPDSITATEFKRLSRLIINQLIKTKN
ncbi:Mrp/NBP35 family ATP-binding protein [Prochlorococcus sp. MIT 1223]|uniref:Mrp/NBP35 family ATP-binding protein n=1 Tax=Prochlorococcus sp. MIT 1223 TaxID=3096217 RepID=UPI002A754C61|nr:Mrp/NBP35 family ATP-binding protein [Prochlorococcus sp. MIT 1223]